MTSKTSWLQHDAWHKDQLLFFKHRIRFPSQIVIRYQISTDDEPSPHDGEILIVLMKKWNCKINLDYVIFPPQCVWTPSCFCFYSQWFLNRLRAHLDRCNLKFKEQWPLWNTKDCLRGPMTDKVKQPITFCFASCLGAWKCPRVNRPEFNHNILKHQYLWVHAVNLRRFHTYSNYHMT